MATTDTSQAQRDLVRGLSRLISFLFLPIFLSLFEFFSMTKTWSFEKNAAITITICIVGRALIDYALKFFFPMPTLFGAEDAKAREYDLINKRRLWFWRSWGKFGIWYTVIVSWLTYKHHYSFVHEWVSLAPHIAGSLAHPAMLLQAVQVVGLFAVNFLIFMGPMAMANISQIKAFEPGDSNLGVKFEDVRGQKDAKEEIKRVISVWESSDMFKELGGKPDRGMLLLGAPGVGKTMIAKAIATSFNAPFVFIPGSGFAATFIGIDVLVVRYMYRKAKKLARKWGGTCIVFIDEIDAVGRRRNNMMGGQVGGMLGGMGGMGMGMMALNQLLVVMDSIESPPWLRKTLVNKFNLILDAIYFVPRSLGKFSLRLPKPKPRGEQVYFLGATNIDLEALDEALTRAGRMGRHIYFRNPTKEDRKDVLDLYVSKVSHEEDLDSPKRRDELARITEGVSPATIEQICSMALIEAQNNGRSKFTFNDFVAAMTTLQAGTATGIEYTDDETVAVARHEAGHAAASHIYCPHIESSRLSILMRGSSLGHHMALEKEERFGRWRDEDFGELVRGIAAMAAEYIFYGQNGRGVSGDLGQVSALSRMMVGRVGMTPYFTKVPDYEVTAPNMEQKFIPRSNEEKVLAQFEFIGKRLLVPLDQQPGVPGGGDKDKLAAQFVGHAFVTAWNFIRLNKDKVENIAQYLVDRKELYGDDVIKLLDEQGLEKFDHLDIENFLDIENWPVL